MADQTAIQNFVTILYERDDDVPGGILPPPWLDCPPKSTVLHNRLQRQLFMQLSEQLAFLYPEATLHVMTDLDIAVPDNVVRHYRKFPHEHLAKLELFGLLDVPAMYLDTDILLLSRFSAADLRSTCPYVMYSANHSFSWTERRGLRPALREHFTTTPPLVLPYLYNGGIVWIREPSRQLVDTLRDLCATYFDPQQIQSRFGFRISDEHALTLLAFQQDWRMPECPHINVPWTSWARMPKAQTVHYSGWHLTSKQQCLADFSKTPTFSAKSAGTCL